MPEVKAGGAEVEIGVTVAEEARRDGCCLVTGSSDPLTLRKPCSSVTISKGTPAVTATCEVGPTVGLAEGRVGLTATVAEAVAVDLVAEGGVATLTVDGGEDNVSVAEGEDPDVVAEWETDLTVTVDGVDRAVGEADGAIGGDPTLVEVEGVDSTVAEVEEAA